MIDNCNTNPISGYHESLSAIQLMLSGNELSTELNQLENVLTELSQALSGLCEIENIKFGMISDLLSTMIDNNADCCEEILRLKGRIDELISDMDICETELPTTTTKEPTTTSEEPITTTTEKPTTTIIDAIACGEVVEYTGGESYPTEKTILLGSDKGQVTLTYDVYTIPDLILVYFDNNIVINTGYKGYGSFYDYGGAGRASFKAALNGKDDPVNGGTYPNFNKYSEDGFPRVTSGDITGFPGRGTATFNKATSTITATVKIFAPMGGTAWSFICNCPE